MIEVPAAMTTCGTLASVASGATASASGVRPKPAMHVDLVVDDQLLREALGVVGDAGVVLDDELDLLAGDGVAVLLHVELDGRLDLLAGRGLLAGHRQDEADLDRVLRPGRAGQGEQRRRGRGLQDAFVCSWCFLLLSDFVVV